MNETEGLVLELLRAIRSDLSSARDDLRELKPRVGHHEEQSASLFGLFAS